MSNKIVMQIFELFQKRSFLFSFLLIGFFFAISRLPLFLFFPVPGGYLTSDILDYFKVALAMHEGQTPYFDIRTPGYPFFLFAIGLFSNKVMSIVVIQNLITLFVSFFFTYAVHANYRKLTYVAAAVVIFYFMSNNSIEADSNLLTNSLYTNLLILFLGILVISINRNKYWVLLSLCFGAIVYVRPSGLFLVPIMLLIALFLLLSPKYKYAWLKLLIPGGAMLFALSFYNLMTLNKFSVSPWGGISLAGASITFLSEDASYAACENQTIREMQAGIPDQDKRDLEAEFDINRHHDIYFNNYYSVIPFYKKLAAYCAYSNYVDALPSIKKISFDAIKKSPEKYFKFVITNFYHYIVHGNLTEHQLFYYSEPERRYETIYSHDYPTADRLWLYGMDSVPLNLLKYTYKEFYEARDNSTYKDRYHALINNPLFKLYDIYTLKVNRIFLRNWFWPLCLVALFFVSGIRLIVSRFTDKAALLVFVICNMNVCSAILVSLVEVSFFHYTYMTEFTYYMALALSPLLLKNIFSR